MSRTYRSFAKLNLHLEVIGRRPDGYHELRTVFQTVALHDEIDLSPADTGVTLEAAGIETPAGPENLAHQAATRYVERWGGDGVALRLDKRIPVGGGLGGGSSNAATVLLALRDLYGKPEQIHEMQTMAADLGADVPFFLVGGTAVGIDRGDRILAVPELREQEVWIVSPAVRVATGEVFAHYRVPLSGRRSSIVDDLLDGQLDEPLETVGFNDLEATVLALFPPVERVYTALVQSGAERVQLSGSGGSMFAFYASPPEESALASALPRGSRIFRTRTLSRQSVEQLRIVTADGES